MIDNSDIQSIEDALINIHETVLNPERAAPLIRKNLLRGIQSEYAFRFYEKGGNIYCESKLNTNARPKFLGKIEGLE